MRTARDESQWKQVLKYFSTPSNFELSVCTGAGSAADEANALASCGRVERREASLKLRGICATGELSPSTENALGGRDEDARIKLCAIGDVTANTNTEATEFEKIVMTQLQKGTRTQVSESVRERERERGVGGDDTTKSYMD